MVAMFETLAEEGCLEPLEGFQHGPPTRTSGRSTFLPRGYQTGPVSLNQRAPQLPEEESGSSLRFQMAHGPCWPL